MVSTIAGDYFNATNFTAELTVNVQENDIAFFGLGQGVSDPTYFNEPSNGLLFRIHNWYGYTGIQVAATVVGGGHYLHDSQIGTYTGPTTFRIRRSGDNVTLSVPSTGVMYTYSLSQYGAMGLTNANTHLFFGNTNAGSIFSNFNVTLGADVAPAIQSVTTSAPSIWPPNGRMVPVSLQVSATGTPQPACTISAVSSNEASVVPGAPEWTISGPLAVNLRAERLGTGTGRVYSIVVTCTNAAGSASQTATVTVPHDQGK